VQPDCTPKLSENSKASARARVTPSQGLRASDSCQLTNIVSPPSSPLTESGTKPVDQPNQADPLAGLDLAALRKLSMITDSSISAVAAAAVAIRQQQIAQARDPRFRAESARRWERYYLQRQARILKLRQRGERIRAQMAATGEDQADLRKKVKAARVVNCLRRVADTSTGYIEILRTDHGRAVYNNLRTCGSVWDCPVCDHVVGARRASQLNELIETWIMRGGTLLHLLRTIQHDREDSLDELVSVLTAGRRYVRSGAPWQRKREAYGVVAEITSLEGTYGGSGWHPHSHTLIFARPGLSAGDISAWRNWEYDRWMAHLAKQDRWAKEGVGVNLEVVRSAADIARYMAYVYNPNKVANSLSRATSDRERNFRLASEFALSGSKNSFGGLTSMDLLSLAAVGFEPAIPLWLEWSDVMFGKNKLTGLAAARKAILDKDTESDQEASEPPEGLPQWAVIEVDGWYAAIEKQGEIRADLLDYVESGQLDIIRQIFADSGHPGAFLLNSDVR